ncbi:MAG TPA: type I-E CRISPR-associated endonuclease Cas1 [Thermoflexia bacterium]|nr:type I-E CRISPR-associated endonuclease Cas1 [Thermoflexia bacterium]
MRDLHELPKLSDSLSYLYIEHAIIEQKAKAVEMVDAQGRVMIPAANLTVLLLGPGTRITHAAVKSLADNGCTIVWVGEDGTRYYAHGGGETRRAYHLLHQARLVSAPHMRLAVCRRMYRRRFGEELEPGLTIQQLRGKEGVRMRTYYAQTSLRYGVEWKGRRYKRGTWEAADPVNRALSSANALLNGLCHAAIVSGGYSAALGFIHTGKQLSFVYDIADLYKTEITIPVAFRTAAQGQRNLHARVRTACRAVFKEKRLLQRILPDIMELLDLPTETLQAGKLADTDPARPEPLWTPADEVELAPALPARAEPVEVAVDQTALRLRRQRAAKGMSGGWTVWQLNPAAWHVITASGPPGYTIQKIEGQFYCTCPDFARTGLGACKHTFAVELFLASETSRLEEEA